MDAPTLYTLWVLVEGLRVRLALFFLLYITKISEMGTYLSDGSLAVFINHSDGDLTFIGDFGDLLPVIEGTGAAIIQTGCATKIPLVIFGNEHLSVADLLADTLSTRVLSVEDMRLGLR